MVYAPFSAIGESQIDLVKVASAEPPVAGGTLVVTQYVMRVGPVARVLYEHRAWLN